MHPKYLLPFLVGLAFTYGSEDKIRACYYIASNDLKASSLDANVCTHIIFAFASLKNNSLVPGRDSDIQTYSELSALKVQNPNLKILISIGGSKNDGFPTMASTPEGRKQFVESTAELLRNNSLDGLDIDWEYPVYGGGNPQDKFNFGKLLQELHEEFKRDNGSLVLSAAVASIGVIIDASYDVESLAKYLDFANIMTYGYHFYQFITPYTGINSPLYPASTDVGYFARFNINWTVQHWLDLGMPASKMLIGLPTYGQTYRLKYSDQHDIKSPASGYGFSGGTATYPQMCRFLQEDFTREFDIFTLSPYAYNASDWVTYDDIESLMIKTSWVKNSSLGGIMTFDLNCDDWQGICNGQPFPLHRIIADVLMS